MESNQKNIKQSEFCKIESTSLCLECNNYYCDACFKYVHDKKQSKNHKKEKIDYFVPMDIKCPEHKGNIINLFCVDEKGNNINII